MIAGKSTRALVLLGFVAGLLNAQETVPPTIPARADFLGAWVTPDFDPVITNTTEPGAEQGKVLHQKMLLFIEPVPEADDLVRCRFYEWNEDRSTVLGPEYGIGVYDPTTGMLTLGGPAQGLNPVKLLPGHRLQYIHAKAMKDNAWMSVRYLDALDAEAARKLEATLKQKTNP